MAIAQVRVYFNGQWVALNWNDATRRYEAEIVPVMTSRNQPDGVFRLTVEAANDSGESATADGSTVPGLNLTVNESIPPALRFLAPTAGFVTDNQPEIRLEALDETDGSGVDPDTLTLTLDGEDWPGILTREAIEGGYQFAFAPAGELSEGRHELRASVRDYDRNLTVTDHAIVIDTVPPVLKLHPGRILTDAASLTLTADVADATAGVDRVEVYVNGAYAGLAELSGSICASTVALPVGVNEILFSATDHAGLTASQSRTVIRLITDRTVDDVDRSRRIQSKLNAGTATDAERTALLADLRGNYDDRALNRVGAAVQILSERLASHGFVMDTSPRISWTVGDVPTFDEWARYLADIEQIRSRYQVTAATPETPATMDRLTYGQANDIEQILLDVDALAELAEQSRVYAGEAFAGEF